jgi:hypothetical protein
MITPLSEPPKNIIFPMVKLLHVKPFNKSAKSQHRHYRSNKVYTYSINSVQQFPSRKLVPRPVRYRTADRKSKRLSSSIELLSTSSKELSRNLWPAFLLDSSTLILTCIRFHQNDKNMTGGTIWVTKKSSKLSVGLQGSFSLSRLLF